MPSLGVNGATPYAQGTNHPTALNHSHRDVSSYDARRQTKMKCTFCGCWATKGSLCYQCKQPTGPLVLPRRNGYRVEPLIGVRTPSSFRRSQSAYATSTRSVSSGGGGGGAAYLSPRQRQRVGSLLLRDENVGATTSDTEGGDAHSQWNKSSTATHDNSYSNPSSSSILVVNRTSSARPATSVYDRIGQPFAYANTHTGNSGASTPRRSTSAAAYGHVSPRLAAGGPYSSPTSAASPSSLYVGGQPAKRYYVSAPGVRASEQLVEHLREHVVAAREDALRDAEWRMKQKQSKENQRRNGEEGTTASDGGDDDEEDDIYGYYKAKREKARAMATAGHGGQTPSSVTRTPSRDTRQQTDASTNSAIRDSHKGVTGGYFYHNDQTALGHKFREETPYDPSLQTKIKCRYCGCWARKNAPCALCKTVNK